MKVSNRQSMSVVLFLLFNSMENRGELHGLLGQEYLDSKVFDLGC